MSDKRPGAFDAWVIEGQDRGVDWGEMNTYNDKTKSGQDDREQEQEA